MAHLKSAAPSELERIPFDLGPLRPEERAVLLAMRRAHPRPFHYLLLDGLPDAGMGHTFAFHYAHALNLRGLLRTRHLHWFLTRHGIAVADSLLKSADPGTLSGRRKMYGVALWDCMDTPLPREV